MYVYILFLDFPIYFTVAEGIYYQDHLNMSGQLCERQQPPPPVLNNCLVAFWPTHCPSSISSTALSHPMQEPVFASSAS